MNTLTLSFTEIAQFLSVVNPNRAILIEGETGIGKTSLAPVVAKARTERTGLTYDVYTLDCTCADVGDVLLPMPKEIRGLMQTEYAPNAAFGVGNDNPIIILLDELGKAIKPVKDALLPLLLEQRVGAHRLPEHSMVIATSNLAEEGLGDSFEPHARNRMTTLQMRKPTSKEWVAYASKSGDVCGEVLAFVQQFPTVFESYQEAGAESNPYINDPRHPERTAFVSPRSLTALSDHVAIRQYIPSDVLLAAMVGAVGEAASRDMLTMLSLADGLPPLASVYNDGTTAKVPKQAVAQLIFGINLVRGAAIETAQEVVTYIQRLEPEIQSVLTMNMVSSPDRMGVFALAPGAAKMIAKLTKYM